MASARAQQLTREHRREVGRVTTTVERQVQAIARRATVSDIDAWWERSLLAILRVVFPGFALLAEMTVRWLRSHAALEGVRLDPVAAELDREALETSLRVTGPVAFKKHMTMSGSEEASHRVMTGQLSRTAAARVLDADRDTVMATFAKSDRMVGWRRVLNSANPCAFCAMLASRGAVYSKNTVGFRAHKPGCSCTAEPLYRHEPEPPEVLALRKLWDDSTAGLGGADALRAFRRAYEKRERAGRPPAPAPEPVDEPTEEAPDEQADDQVDTTPAPPPEPYPGGLTEKGAQEWMQQRWGEDEIGKRAILFQGLGADAANEMAATIDDLFTRYPNTAKRIRVLGASAPVTKAVNTRGGPRLRNISGRAYADAARQIGSLRVSGPKARKAAELKAMLTRDVETGWHPPGTDSLAAVVRHEFGHFMYWEAQDRGGVGPPNRELEDTMVKATGAEPGTSDYYRRRYDVQREQVSRYATTNGDELMAEAFAYVTSSDEPSQLASDFVEVLVRYAEG